MAGPERRGSPRQNVHIVFEIDGRPTPPGDSIDHISLTGAFIRTVQPLSPKTRVVIRLTTPKSDEVLRFDGEVIRTITPEEAPKAGSAPGMAIEFLDLGQGSPRPMLSRIVDEIDELIDESQRAHDKRRVGDTPEQTLDRFFEKLETANHYELLGVDATADRRKLKKAYYRRCKQVHPDRFRGAGPVVRARAEEAYQILTEAYALLADAESRAEYDATHGIVEAVAARQERVGERLLAATRAEKAGRLVRAGIEAKLALSLDPDNAEATELLTRIQADNPLFVT